MRGEESAWTRPRPGSWCLAVLAVVALLVLRGGRAGTRNRLTPLSGLAIGCIVAGIVFGEDRWLAYGLFAVGARPAVVDMVRRSREILTDTTWDIATSEPSGEEDGDYLISVCKAALSQLS